MNSTAENTTVPVWDPYIRIFHWSLTGFFTIAYFSAEESEHLHEWSGYAVAGLIAFRVSWGFIGPFYARFRQFIYRPREIIDYLRSLTGTSVRHYLGHNPAGGAMAIALLLSLAVVTVTGMALAGGEGYGPLAQTALANLPEDPLEEVHEFFANLTVALIGLHVIGVLLSSFRHRENLVRGMITGRKQARPGATDQH